MEAVEDLHRRQMSRDGLRFLVCTHEYIVAFPPETVYYNLIMSYIGLCNLALANDNSGWSLTHYMTACHSGWSMTDYMTSCHSGWSRTHYITPCHSGWPLTHLIHDLMLQRLVIDSLYDLMPQRLVIDSLHDLMPPTRKSSIYRWSWTAQWIFNFILNWEVSVLL